jgi:hypothetical protein
MQSQYSVYKLSFLRYILIATGIILALVFGMLWFVMAFDISLDGNNGIYNYLFVFAAMALGIFSGARLSKTLYIITPVEGGLKLLSKSPLGKQENLIISWLDIENANYGTFGNGSTLTINIRNPKLNLEFTGGLLTGERDLEPLYNLIQSNLEEQTVVNTDVNVHRPVTFINSRMAFILAALLSVIMILIPVLAIMNRFTFRIPLGGYTFLKIVWIYLTGLPFIYYVWKSRRHSDLQDF